MCCQLKYVMIWYIHLVYVSLHCKFGPPLTSHHLDCHSSIWIGLSSNDRAVPSFELTILFLTVISQENHCLGNFWDSNTCNPSMWIHLSTVIWTLQGFFFTILGLKLYDFLILTNLHPLFLCPRNILATNTIASVIVYYLW